MGQLYFTINRRIWLTPRRFPSHHSQLYNRVCKAYCCLGQIAVQCGVNRHFTDLFFSLGELPAIEKIKLPYHLIDTYGCSSDLTRVAVAINDDRTICDDERELRLMHLFAPHGIVLSFLD